MGKSKIKRGRPRGSKKKLHITYEIIIPSGVTESNPSIPFKTPEERWEEIVKICSAIISEFYQNILIDI